MELASSAPRSGPRLTYGSPWQYYRDDYRRALAERDPPRKYFAHRIVASQSAAAIATVVPASASALPSQQKFERFVCQYQSIRRENMTKFRGAVVQVCCSQRPSPKRGLRKSGCTGLTKGAG